MTPALACLGSDGYEEARRAAIWNGRKPNRFPDWILVAANKHDAINGVRSGGHNLVATGVRDRGLLIDLSRLTDIELDFDAK
jgi:hypothetical protein